MADLPGIHYAASMHETEQDNPTALPRSPLLLTAGDSALLIVDVQEKLLPLITDAERMVWNCRRLIDAFKLFDVPVAATEQYPQGLGPTVAELAERLPQPPAKIAFSCGACGEIFAAWESLGIHKILLAGIETHVCVQQTAHDLLAAGFAVFVAADAVAARFAIDHETALRRMDSAGVTVTTTEAAMFEICERAGTPQFKQLSQLVRETAPE